MPESQSGVNVSNYVVVKDSLRQYIPEDLGCFSCKLLDRKIDQMTMDIFLNGTSIQVHIEEVQRLVNICRGLGESCVLQS